MVYKINFLNKYKKIIKIEFLLIIVILTRVVIVVMLYHDVMIYYIELGFAKYLNTIKGSLRISTIC